MHGRRHRVGGGLQFFNLESGGATDCGCETSPRGRGRGLLGPHAPPHRGMVRVSHPYGRAGHGPHKIHFLHPAANRHYYAWLPTGGQHREGAWMHFEPMGGREIAPGRIVGFHGVEVPRHLIPNDWPRMHFTPPPSHLRRPPPRPPMSIHHKPAIVAAPTHSVPGHWGWSKVLHRHVWIGGHQTSSEVNIKGLPPAQRQAARELMKAHGAKWAQSHSIAGIGGARNVLIPGHWQFDHHTRDWKYVEQHTDRRVSYAAHDAPAAAFGPRPAGLPFMHFWPIDSGEMRDGRNRVPSNAPTMIEIPSHARYAAAHGLLTPQHIRTVLGGSPASVGGSGVYAAAHPGEHLTNQRRVLAADNIIGADGLAPADQMTVMRLVAAVQHANDSGNSNAAAQATVNLNNFTRSRGVHLRYPGS